MKSVFENWNWEPPAHWTRIRTIDMHTGGPHDAVIPEVGGTASITGRSEFYFDPEDPLGHGFIFR
jgi:trans-L-3-hydroxyproline dehydratase